MHYSLLSFFALSLVCECVPLFRSCMSVHNMKRDDICMNLYWQICCCHFFSCSGVKSFALFSVSPWKILSRLTTVTYIQFRIWLSQLFGGSICKRVCVCSFTVYSAVYDVSSIFSRFILQNFNCECSTNGKVWNTQKSGKKNAKWSNYCRCHAELARLFFFVRISAFNAKCILFDLKCKKCGYDQHR